MIVEMRYCRNANTAVRDQHWPYPATAGMPRSRESPQWALWTFDTDSDETSSSQCLIGQRLVETVSYLFVVLAHQGFKDLFSVT